MLKQVQHDIFNHFAYYDTVSRGEDKGEGALGIWSLVFGSWNLGIGISIEEIAYENRESFVPE